MADGNVIKSVVDAFNWLLPHSPTLLIGVVLGLCIAAVLFWWTGKQRVKSSPLWFLAIVTAGALIFTMLRSLYVFESHEQLVLGGFSLTDAATEYIAHERTTLPDTIDAFNGWSDPERVWTRGGLTLAKVAFVLSIAVFLGGLGALVRRLPSLKKVLVGVLGSTARG